MATVYKRKPAAAAGRRGGGKAKASARPARKPSFLDETRSFLETYAAASAAGVGVLLLVGAGVLWAGGYFGLLGERLSRAAGEAAVSAGLEVRRVTLLGRSQTANDELEAALGNALGGSILHFDLADARRRIESLGWVRSAAVSRLLPDTVHISIREREPSAVWQMAGDLHLIDESGARIQEIGAYEYSYLPLIVGAGAPEAASGILRALARYPELKGEAAALVRAGERRWNMRLRNGVDVKLPEQDYAAALAALATLQAAHGTLDQPLEYIDLRDPERTVIRRRGEPTDNKN